MIMTEIKNIKKKYGKKIVLEDISFSVQEGKCVGILGGNGCGKSTLLSILAGVQKADNGSFLWEGADLFADGKVRSEILGYVPQGNPLMEANPGGAPCNVLALLQKLGHRTAFIGRVGDDMFAPKKNAGRAEAAVIIHRCMEKLGR